MINAYALAIATDSASDSTLDAMQFDIDCILFAADIPDDIDERDFAPIDSALFDSAHIASLESLRAYAIAAFNLRP